MGGGRSHPCFMKNQQTKNTFAATLPRRSTPRVTVAYIPASVSLADFKNGAIAQFWVPLAIRTADNGSQSTLASMDGWKLHLRVSHAARLGGTPPASP